MVLQEQFLMCAHLHTLQCEWTPGTFLSTSPFLLEMVANGTQTDSCIFVPFGSVPSHNEHGSSHLVHFNALICDHFFPQLVQFGMKCIGACNNNMADIDL